MKNPLIVIDGQYRGETDAFARKLARCLDLKAYDPISRVLSGEETDYEEVMELLRQQQALFRKELAWRGVVTQDSHLRAKAEYEARNRWARGSAALPGSPEDYLLPSAVVLINPPRNQTFAYLCGYLDEGRIPYREFRGKAVARSPVVGPTLEYLAPFLAHSNGADILRETAPAPRTAAPPASRYSGRA